MRRMAALVLACVCAAGCKKAAPTPVATVLVDRVHDADGGFMLSALTVDESHVYWATGVSPIKVGRVRKSGGTTESVATITVVASGVARAIAAAGTRVFVFTQETQNHSMLWSVPKTGGQLTSVAVGEDVDAFCENQCMVGAGEHVYWIGGDTIRWVDAHGKAATLIAGQTKARYIATDGARIFWTARDPVNTHIRSAALDGGGVSDVATLPSDTLPEYGLAVDATHVHLGVETVLPNRRTSGVWSVPKTGGTGGPAWEVTPAPRGMRSGGSAQLFWNMRPGKDDYVGSAAMNGAAMSLAWEWRPSNFQLFGFAADARSVFALGLVDAKKPTLYRLDPPVR